MAKKRKTAVRSRARKNSLVTSTRREWDQFEQTVIRTGTIPAPGTRRAGPPAAATADDVLLRLAKRSQIVRGRQQPLGNVVFLHGITGADLAVSKGFGKLESIWVSILDVVAGGMQKLRLAADGAKSLDSTLQIHATGINKRFYGRAVLALRAHWNVEPFAYDWRKDINAASDNLAALIRQRFADEPVHLVAHSMGGLVARNFIRRHREQWLSMRDPALVRGGRLVMLGTPNYGSYAIVQVLCGTDALMSRLERFDLQHNMNQMLEITNSFPGTYQLLPALSHLMASEQGLYEQPTWGATRGISQRHLNRALEFQRELDTPATTDPERLVYVAGVNQSTIQGVQVLGPGQFEYQISNEGDGRVPLRLGGIKGVPSYYVDELHGDLAKNEQILLALDELLQEGSTTQLAASAAAATASRGGVALRSARTYRAPDRGALDMLTDLAARTRQAGGAHALTPAEQQLAADAILNAAVSARTDVTVVNRQQPAAKAKAGTDAAAGTRARGTSTPGITLRVGARLGRIEKFRAPIVVVGHYRGVKPVKAIGAIDRAMGNWLTRAVRRGMISGQTGETFFIPTRGRGVAADGVIVAGMGDYGTFTTSSLRRVMANVAQGATALEIPEVATVLIGAGEGGLSAEAALRHLIEGFASGLAELKEELKGQAAQATLWIVEVNAQRFVALDREVQELAERPFIEGVQLKAVAAPKAMRDKARQEFRSHAEREFDRAALTEGRVAEVSELCLTVETGPDQAGGARQYHFSALTDRALVPVQKIEVSAAVVKDLGERLCEVTAPNAQDQYGRLLFRYLLPKEFASLFEAEGNIRLIVDSASAAFPWEMACMPSAESADRLQRFGVERRLTRQFKSLVSGSVGLIPPRNEKLRALVIADPAKEPEWRLPGARAEGHLVARLLRFANGMTLTGSRAVKLDIDVHEFIGSEDCEPLDLIARLTSGDYDLVHYAGHGIYDGDDPSRSGWVLGADYFVTARDIARSLQTPWLIFANACFSAVVNGAAQQQPIETARQAASIAEAFMQLGVRNYLGTGWVVDDDQAQRFAREFYFRMLFGNQRLGESLSDARGQLLAEGQGSTWGAYQFYGDPADRLLPRLADQSMEMVEECRERFEIADV